MPIKYDEKAKLFAREYIVDFNGVRAARAVGYTGNDNVLAVTASRLLKDERVQKELQKATAQRAKRTGVTADLVVAELARLGFSDIRDVVEWDEEGRMRLKPSAHLKKKIARAIKEITERVTTREGCETVVTTIKLHDKVKPLELLGKHTGALAAKPDDDADSDEERVVVHLPDNGRDKKSD